MTRRGARSALRRGGWAALVWVLAGVSLAPGAGRAMPRRGLPPGVEPVAAPVAPWRRYWSVGVGYDLIGEASSTRIPAPLSSSAASADSDHGTHLVTVGVETPVVNVELGVAPTRPEVIDARSWSVLVDFAGARRLMGFAHEGDVDTVHLDEGLSEFLATTSSYRYRQSISAAYTRREHALYTMGALGFERREEAFVVEGVATRATTTRVGMMGSRLADFLVEDIRLLPLRRAFGRPNRYCTPGGFSVEFACADDWQVSGVFWPDFGMHYTWRTVEGPQRTSEASGWGVMVGPSFDVVYVHAGDPVSLGAWLSLGAGWFFDGLGEEPSGHRYGRATLGLRVGY
ncbi:MAG: hypothetical protein H6705_10640 [Myxococcales bacterium]|nr:hypothetical protein [Myxococcales bacterium]